MQIAALLWGQIPFENFHLCATMLPDKSQVRFEVRWVDPCQILAPYILWIGDTIAATRVPKQNGSIWAHQPQSRVMASGRSVYHDYLKQRLIRDVYSGFHADRSSNPTAWPMRRWRMHTARRQTDAQKHRRNDPDPKASSFSGQYRSVHYEAILYNDVICCSVSKRNKKFTRDYNKYPSWNK